MLGLHHEVSSSPPQASEWEGHRSELQQLLEQWEKEKAEAEREHEKQLFEMKQEVAAVQAQQEEERTRVENAKQEVKTVKGELVWCLSSSGLHLGSASLDTVHLGRSVSQMPLCKQEQCLSNPESFVP